MERLLGTKAVPPGFRFYPTDEELFMYYLKRKVMGRSLQPEMIAEVDVYRFAPWDLPAMACLKTRDLNWFFFCPRAKKYPKGGRANRATECGYWKSTGNDRTVYYHSRPVGKIKTLVFHRGKAPAGERTDWVMHEYRLEDNDLVAKGVPQDSYVICKIYEKSGMGPKNGETYGARFIEEEWDSDNDDNGRGAGSEVMVQSPDVSGSAVDNPSVAHAVITPINAAVTVAIVDDPPTTLEPAVATVDGAATTFEPAVANVVDAATTFEPAVATTYATASAADTTSAPAFAATTAASAPAAPATVPLSASEEEEMDWLLSYFTPEGDIGDIYDGLGDLCSPPRMDNLDWRIPFIEMDDLNSQLK